MEMTRDFCSFREEDFRLFQGDAPTDRRFNKNRLDLKERLVRFGERLAPRMPAGWTMESGTEHPAVWNRQRVDRLELFFMRSEEDRKRLNRAMAREIPISLLLQAPSPLYAHASIGFFVDARGIEAGFRVPFLAVGDRQQLRRALESDGWTDAAVHDGHVFGVFSGESPQLFSAQDPRQWLEALARLEEAGNRDHRAYLGLVQRFSPGEAVMDGIGERIESTLVQILPIIHSLVWSPEHDRLGVDGLIQAQNRASQAERERSEKLRQELVAPKPVVARPVLSSRDTSSPAREAAAPSPKGMARESRSGRRPSSPVPPPAASRPAGAAKTSSTPPVREEKADAASLGAKAKARESGKKSSSPKTSATVPVKQPAVGDAVVLGGGPFAGKDAVVLAVLSDGQLRVRVGMLQLLVDAADVRMRA